MSTPFSEDRRTPTLRTLGLRGRTTVAVAAGALIVSIAAGVIAHQTLRRFVVDQRVDGAIQDALLNAADFQSSISSGGDLVDAVFVDADSDSPVVVRSKDQWYSSVPEYGESSVSRTLSDAVANDRSAVLVTDVKGSPHVAVGIDMASPTDTQYYQFVNLASVESNLGTLRNGVALAVIALTTAAALVGSSISKRVLRPLRTTAEAAQQIASGELGTRLDAERDPDLAPLVDAFNDMAESLQERIDRERRFATDVSHELRTPLAAMGSAVALMRRREAEMSPTARSALDELDRRTQQFSRLALDVLDLSRLEVDLVQPEPEWTTLRELVENALDSDAPAPPVEFDSVDPSSRCRVDPRRIRVMLRNLLENADRYAGGATRIGVRRESGSLVIDVDDAGPGVSAEERITVFERFHRGTASTDQPGIHGNGLGLALVAENARALGGTVSVVDRPDPGPGARFRIDVPVEWPMPRSTTTGRAETNGRAES